MTDPYASEADTLALIRRDQRSDVEKKLEAMLDERGALEMGAEPFLILRQITLEQMTTIESIKQAITDPENQPSQFGTVTLAHMQREVTAEREACAKVCADLWCKEPEPGDARDCYDAIIARGQA
jgi:hypothetical protein